MKRLSVTSQKRSRPRMCIKTLINTALKVSDGKADMRHVIQIFLLELILTYRYPLKLSVDIERKILKLIRKAEKGSVEAEEDPDANGGTTGGGGAGARS